MMKRLTENSTKPPLVGQIALLVIPPVSQNADLYCSPMGGMAFIVRQARLVARANVSEIWILCPSSFCLSSQKTISTCVPDHRYAPTLKILFYNPENENHTDALSALPRAERYVVSSANCVYDQKMFSSLADFDLKDQHNCQVITPGDKNDAIWICDAKSLALAVEAVSDPASALPENIITLETDIPAFRVTSKNDIEKLEQHLWNQCRKDIDGIVSTWFNRHISLAISRRIINTTISPNQVTVFAVLLGVLASFIASSGNYFAVLIGASLMQISSIIDGVDGEIARMRVQGSLLGEWLDTIGDDVVNICFVLAIGYGAHITGADDIWPYLAVFCAMLMSLISAIYYVWLSRAGRGDILSTDWFQSDNKPTGNHQENGSEFSTLKATIYDWATRLFRRDLLIVIIFFTALAGVVQYSLLIFIPASLATLGAQLVKMFDGKK